MLELAYLNKKQLSELYANSLQKKKSKYFLFRYHIFSEQIESNDFNRLQFVSKDTDGKIFWYIACNINRNSNIIDKLTIINISEKFEIVAAKDLMRFLEYIFCKRKFRKIVFTALENNPAVESYIRLIVKKKIGRIVGKFKEQSILPDETICDQVIFEIYRDKFEKSNYKDFI